MYSSIHRRSNWRNWPKSNRSSEESALLRTYGADFEIGGSDDWKQTYREKLLTYIASNRNVENAWNHLEAFGGASPGPNGHRLSDYDRTEKFRLLRCLSQAMTQGRYKPGPERTIRIPKVSGKGYRTVSIRNIEDRIVERAVLQGIAPLLPQFDGDDATVALDRRVQLAQAEQLTVNEGQTFWIVDDIRDAFTQTPLKRLLDVLRMHLPDDVLGLVECIVENGAKRGLRQGSPLSPALMNAYLHHMLDRQWKRLQPDTRLLRTVDDVLILCDSRRGAEEAYEALRRQLTAAAMPLKGEAEEAIHELVEGDRVSWLGFDIRQTELRLACRIGDRSWDQLEHHLSGAHAKPYSSLVANDAVNGWISQLGPCYEHEDVEAVCDQLVNMAESYAFDECPDRSELQEGWRGASDRWTEIRCSTRQNLADGDQPS